MIREIHSKDYEVIDEVHFLFYRTSAMWRSLGLTLALCLLPYGGAESQGQSPACKQPPAWKIGDENPMLNSEGTVTVVALLQAS